MSAPLTPEQEARVREIIVEERYRRVQRAIDRANLGAITWFEASRDPQRLTAQRGGSLDPQ
jgi:hypothetical protein